MWIFATERVADGLQLQSEGQRRILFAAIIIPAALGISFADWKTGSYRVRVK
jgi:hypothetical protein